MDTLSGQIDYYRARAGEYDEWFYRTGRYDQGSELNQRWFEEAQECRVRLESIGPVDTALELAAGTGIWTEELVKLASRVTAVDASAEVLAINRGRLGAQAQVSYLQADLFDWEPQGQFDLVSFTFWLSHVPPAEVDRFLEKVYRATNPGGRVFMVDSLRASTSTAANQSVHHTDIHQRRILNDGRAFDIIKVYYEANQLRELFERAGFQADVGETQTYFLHVVATR